MFTSYAVIILDEKPVITSTSDITTSSQYYSKSV